MYSESKAVHRSPNKLWKSYSIFNLPLAVTHNVKKYFLFPRLSGDGDSAECPASARRTWPRAALRPPRPSTAAGGWPTAFPVSWRRNRCRGRPVLSPMRWVMVVHTAVLDPQDLHVFGPPGSGSISQRYGSRSRSFPFLKKYFNTKF
jgi:hypothetical protein